MPIFIKTEKFSKKTSALSNDQLIKSLREHKDWVKTLISSGAKLSSGYLADRNRDPGGGGFLVLEATSFEEAKSLIEQDPMIKNNLVTWELHEWIPVAGSFFN
ncbi:MULTISPECIES: YciI family protein [Prochlorococcus]|uniref:YciI family protein n=1 Tax=Prochlorococcus TaxID=1218 RepID=UPI000533B4EC|nr:MULTISPECIES: YciI family protein [Prochlorococcus]KGG13543.1 putative YCII family conserved protein [Prochlorococcus sp. MIT 0601]